jgi:hypothetical protein
MAYKLVTVRDETFPGDEVEKVIGPDEQGAAWVIYLKKGIRIMTTHPVTVIEEVKP